jgi:Leucine-rich repeat (LRR) protein
MNQNFLSIEDRRLEKLFELRELSMSKCSIEKILSEIGTCVNIQRLDLSHNRIQILPVGIGLLTQLEELNLSNNFLADIPMELGSCKTLHHLELQRNLFSGQLTDYLGLIRNLRYLDISFNTHLTSLPNSIVGISQVFKDLFIHGI